MNPQDINNNENLLMDIEIESSQQDHSHGQLPQQRSYGQHQEQISYVHHQSNSNLIINSISNSNKTIDLNTIKQVSDDKTNAGISNLSLNRTPLKMNTNAQKSGRVNPYLMIPNPDAILRKKASTVKSPIPVYRNLKQTNHPQYLDQQRRALILKVNNQRIATPSCPSYREAKRRNISFEYQMECADNRRAKSRVKGMKSIKSIPKCLNGRVTRIRKNPVVNKYILELKTNQMKVRKLGLL